MQSEILNECASAKVVLHMWHTDKSVAVYICAWKEREGDFCHSMLIVVFLGISYV